MEKQRFHRCSLAGAEFDDVNLGNARFSNVNLAGATLDNVNLSNLKVTNAKITGLTIFGYDVAAWLKEQLARDGCHYD